MPRTRFPPPAARRRAESTGIRTSRPRSQRRPATSSPSGARSDAAAGCDPLGARGAERTLKRRLFMNREGRAEVQQRIEDVGGLEVSLAAPEMDVSAGRERPLLVEDEADAPAAALDELLAAAAACLSRGGEFRAVDALQAIVREGVARDALQRLAAGDPARCSRQPFQHRIRTLVSGAQEREQLRDPA